MHPSLFRRGAGGEVKIHPQRFTPFFTPKSPKGDFLFRLEANSLISIIILVGSERLFIQEIPLKSPRFNNYILLMIDSFFNPSIVTKIRRSTS